MLCNGVALGDVLALKRGAAGGRFEVLAVGEVTGTYEFSETLDDVEGWNLGHYRQVLWHPAPRPTLIDGLRRGTLYRTSKAAPRIRALIQEWPARPAPRVLPAPAPRLDLEYFIQQLVIEGLSVSVAEQIAGAIARLRHLAQWYRGYASRVSEHEIRTFLIVPLLLALGWPEQRIKIELEHVDIGLFDRPYAADAKLELLIESKHIDASLGERPEWQAAGYAEKHKSCKQLLITDGFRYKLFRRKGSDWAQVAYANLLALRDRHPYLEELPGASELLTSLLPN